MCAHTCPSSVYIRCTGKRRRLSERACFIEFPLLSALCWQDVILRACWKELREAQCYSFGLTITHKSFQNGLSPPVSTVAGKKTSWARNLPRSPRRRTSILYCEIMCEWESVQRKQPEASLILEMPQERTVHDTFHRVNVESASQRPSAASLISDYSTRSINQWTHPYYYNSNTT